MTPDFETLRELVTELETLHRREASESEVAELYDRFKWELTHAAAIVIWGKESRSES